MAFVISGRDPHPVTGWSFVVAGLLALAFMGQSVLAIVEGRDLYARLTVGHVLAPAAAIAGIFIGAGLIKGMSAACLAARLAGWGFIGAGFVVAGLGASQQDQEYGGFAVVGGLVFLGILGAIGGAILAALRHRPAAT